MRHIDQELEAVRERIEADAKPAYLKDSELRYVHVNAAYARLWGCEADGLLGKRTDDYFDGSDYADRDEKERRSLIFGKDQVALFTHPSTEDRYRVHVGRLRLSDGRLFITGRFEGFSGVQYFGASRGGTPETPKPRLVESTPDRPARPSRGDFDVIKAAIEASDQPLAVAAADGRLVISNAAYRAVAEEPGALWQTSTAADGSRLLTGARQPSAEGESPPPSSFALAERIATFAFAGMGAGVLVCDGDDTLVLANDTFREGFGEEPLDLHPGMRLRDVLDLLYDRLTVAIDDCAPESGRTTWVAERLRDFAGASCDGAAGILGAGWVQYRGRRLDNGILVVTWHDVTELKRQEMEFAERIEEASIFQAVLDVLPFPAFVKDEDFRIRFVNRAHSEMTGVSLENVLGRTDFDLYGDLARTVREADENVFATGALVETEQLVPGRAGDLRLLGVRKNRLVFPDGRKFIVGSSYDLTAIRRREEELSEARAQAELLRSDLESVIDAMNIGVLVVDADLKVELVNDTFFRIWERPPGDVIGTHLSDMMHANRRAGHYDILAENWDDYVEARLESVRRGRVDPVEVRRTDGVSLIFSARPLTRGRRLLCYLDVTEIRDHEREIANARTALDKVGQLLSEAVSAMAQGLVICRDDRILLTNDAFYSMLGVSKDRFGAGASWSEYIAMSADRGDYGSEEDSTIAVKNMHRRIAEGIPHTLLRRGANGRWVRVDANPSRTGNMVVTYTDITEAKQREDELEGLLSRAEEADRAKTEFLANMSHEIRTPMNGVLGMAELLTRTPLDLRQRTFADVIVKSGTALMAILNDILDFSRIDAGRLELDDAPFDLAECVEDTVSLVSSQFAEKHIDLVLRVDPGLATRVRGDAGRFRQIVLNLVNNAAKFTERGHVFVDVTGRDVAPDRIAVEIRVEDTGIGIPADKLEAIFGKFTQVDGTHTRRHEGTGLGLAIASRLAALMQGSISVESTPGKGSVFTFAAALEKVEAAARAEAEETLLAGRNIVLLDLSPLSRRVLVERISAWGADCIAVEDRREAIALLRGAAEAGIAVDCVLCDHKLPVLDGFGFAASLAKDPLLATIPVVVMTTADTASHAFSSDAAGVRGQILRPVRASALLETLLATTGEPMPQPAVALPMPDDLAIALPSFEGPDRRVASANRTTRVLVAEDNDVNQIVFRQILEEFGHDYEIVANGALAVEAFRRRRPDLVLMDVSMPVMNGYQAAGEIRRLEAADGAGDPVPIIGVTAHALEDDRERCLAAGMDDYLPKPISPERLGEKMALWLGQKRVSAGSAAPPPAGR